MRLVLQEGLIQAIAGLAIGLAAAVSAMRGFRTVLFQVSPADPLTLAAVAVLPLVTAALACIVPATRHAGGPGANAWKLRTMNYER